MISLIGYTVYMLIFLRAGFGYVPGFDAI